jgi:hypothetical protein
VTASHDGINRRDTSLKARDCYARIEAFERGAGVVTHGRKQDEIVWHRGRRRSGWNPNDSCPVREAEVDTSLGDVVAVFAVAYEEHAVDAGLGE